MRIDTLYEFILLATNLNFTDTAKSFFIAQSALSNHISKLERELGAKLFTRDNRSVALTKVGKTFLEDAKKIVADYECALDNVAMCRQGTSSLLRIGVPPRILRLLSSRGLPSLPGRTSGRRVLAQGPRHRRGPGGIER